MNQQIMEEWLKDGLLSERSWEKITERNKTIEYPSLHFEIKSLLYLGVSLLCTGLGILIYKHIDSTGHLLLTILIGSISLTGYIYCYKTALPFSSYKVPGPNLHFDYILILAGLCFVTLIGYLQFRYHFFGDRLGLATFIPMLVLAWTAYYFDHLGILCLAITNLAAWAGIVVTPLGLLKENDFSDDTVIITGILLGLFLGLMAIATRIKNFKSHFEFTYLNFGMNLLFISLLAAIIHFDRISLLFLLLSGLVAWYYFLESYHNRSFYLLLMVSLYFYASVSYVAVDFFFGVLHGDLGGVYLSLLYLVGSGIALIRFLMKMNKKFNLTT